MAYAGIVPLLRGFPATTRMWVSKRPGTRNLWLKCVLRVRCACACITRSYEMEGAIADMDDKLPTNLVES